MLSGPQMLTSSGGRVATILLTLVVVTSAALAKRAVDPAPGGASAEQPLAGLVEPTDTTSVTTAAPVVVAEALATVGDELQAGQPLVRADVSDAQRDLAALALEIEHAEQDVADHEHNVAWATAAIARLASGDGAAAAQLALAQRDAQQVPVRQAKDSPERAMLAYQQAVAKQQRAEELASEGLVPRSDVEDARFAVKLAADDLANAKRAAEAARRVHVAETRQLRAQREQSLADRRKELDDEQSALAQAQLRLKAAQLRDATARQSIDDPFLRMPRDGVVVEMAVHPGDRLAAGSTIARIASLDPMEIRIDVPAALVNALHARQAVSLDVPAVAIDAAPGEIRSIAPLPADDGRYPVRVRFRNPRHIRLAGQAAYVRLAPPAKGGHR